MRPDYFGVSQFRAHLLYPYFRLRSSRGLASLGLYTMRTPAPCRFAVVLLLLPKCIDIMSWILFIGELQVMNALNQAHIVTFLPSDIESRSFMCAAALTMHGA